jgi:uncharacterized protein (DUF433 family)
MTTTPWQERIVTDPKVLVGKPVIKGTRLAVEFVLELLAERWSHEQILKSYPQLNEEDIWAVLQYAAETIKQERVYPLPSEQIGYQPLQGWVVGTWRP